MFSRRVANQMGVARVLISLPSSRLLRVSTSSSFFLLGRKGMPTFKFMETRLGVAAPSHSVAGKI